MLGTLCSRVIPRDFGSEMAKERQSRPSGSRSLFTCFAFPIVRAEEADSRRPEAGVRPAPLLPFMSPDFDRVGGRHAFEPGQLMQRITEGETGLDRIKAMFSTDEYGSFGPEWTLILYASYSALMSGAVIGGFQGARRAKDSYLARNKATVYNTEMHARRALQDRITLGVFSGASRLGLKTGAFTFLYVFNTTLLSVYRGNTSFVDFIAAGCLSGFLWRFTMGPKAALVSSVLGGFLGLFAGCCSTMAFYFTGISMEELRYYHYYKTSKALTGRIKNSQSEPSDDDNIKDDDKPTKPDINLPLSTTPDAGAGTGTSSRVAGAPEAATGDMKPNAT